MMVKSLPRQGNSSALVIDRQLMQLLDLDRDQAVKVTVEGRKLIVEPLSDQEREMSSRKSCSRRAEECRTVQATGEVALSFQR
jgi:antitoxin component of MazEF toxin-antitoxin module